MKTETPRTERNPQIWLSSVFLSVLGLKIAASFFLASPYLAGLFVPFLNRFVESGFLNPWEFFYPQGMLRMFPYPGVMLWILGFSRWLFSPILPAGWQTVTPLHFVAVRAPLLAFDVLLFAVLLRFFPTQRHRALWIYWCSPIIFFVNYVHGQLDIVPTALFFASVYLLVRGRIPASLLVFAAGAAAKTHLIIAFPFVLIFLYKKKVGWKRLLGYVCLFAGAYGLLLSPYAGSEAFRKMVFDSPEQRKLFDFAVPIAPSLRLLVCPTAVVLLMIKFASYKKLNQEILLMFLGIVFASLVIFVPPMPGWFVWSLPFLIYFYMNNKTYSRAPFILYNAIYLFYFLFFFEREPVFLERLFPGLPVRDLALSLVISSVGFIAFWMFNLGVRKNEELKLSEEPVLIGIGGDSGSGKSTLLRVLRTLTGKARSIPISGDDFHKWERGNQNWQVYTHLHPSANRLHRGLETAVALRDGKTVEMGRYDHATGKFTDPRSLEPSKFIFFVGLHPFYLKTMRDLMRVKIFMDTDEPLRRYWKIARDVGRRGYERGAVLEQISVRRGDRERFVEPQKEFADLVIRHEALAPLSFEPPMPADIPLKTVYTMDNSIDLEPLLAGLSETPALAVTHATTVHKQEVQITGTISAAEIMDIAYQLGLNFDELNVNTRGWLKNHHGVTQLVFLLVYNHNRRA